MNDRKQHILQAATALAQEKGHSNLTRDEVATRAQVSTGLVNRYFGDMQQLQRAVMREAVERRMLPVIAVGLALRDPIALGAPQELRREALATLS